MNVCFNHLARDKYNFCIFVAMQPLLVRGTKSVIEFKSQKDHPKPLDQIFWKIPLYILASCVWWRNIATVKIFKIFPHFFPRYPNISICSKNYKILEHVLMCGCSECEGGYCSGITQLSLLGTRLPPYRDISDVTRAIMYMIWYKICNDIYRMSQKILLIVCSCPSPAVCFWFRPLIMSRLDRKHVGRVPAWL